VSYPCHQCGVEVDQGSPFCRKCGAPQIRVSRGDEPEPATIAVSDSPTDSFAAPVTTASGTFDRKVARWQALKAAPMVALVLAVSLSSAWLLLSLLLIPLAGILAVQFYAGRTPHQQLSAGAGAGIGLFTGFLGFLIFAIPIFPYFLWTTVLHPDPADLQKLHAQMEAAVQRSASPQAPQIAQSLLSPNGLLVILIITFIALLALTLVLSAIGGAIGASIARRRP
jgi:hypothetical protein